MATSSQDTNIADIAAPASATPTNIGHVLGLNAAKTQDVLVPLSMLRQVIAQELQSALSAITGGSPNVPVLDGGNLKYMTLANFAKVAGEQSGVYDGIFIMYHRKSDDSPVLANLNRWTSLQNAGEVADGVTIINGGKILVVAPTEATSNLKWSSAVVSGGATTADDRVVAMNDWAGRANTTSILNHSTSSAITNTPSYAPGYCNNYSRVNTNNKGMTAGKWWLPSLGEIMMIYANMTKVNYALSLISGATQLEETWYWTSTEHSATYAWILNLSNGNLIYSTKSSNTFSVRPVSAFIA